MNLAYIGLVSAGMAVACIAWRYLCKFYNIPWPYWLAWWLENPYMKVVCHPDRIAGLSEIDSGMKVCDLGCGAGRVTSFLAQRAYPEAVIAVDFQRGMLRLLKKKLMRGGVSNVVVRELDISQSRLPDKMDRFVITTVLGEIPDFPSVLARVFEALVPGGRVSITEVIPDPCYISSKTLRRVCESLGYRYVNVHHNWLAYTMNLEKPHSSADSADSKVGFAAEPPAVLS